MIEPCLKWSGYRTCEDLVGDSVTGEAIAAERIEWAGGGEEEVEYGLRPRTCSCMPT